LNAALQLNEYIFKNFSYDSAVTDVETTIDEVWKLKAGVCQDFAHVLLVMLHMIDIPARYVSGYLLIDGTTEQVATHAWAEAHVDGLGWVAFDVSNGISPDGRYVRLATGRDYRDAMPISGIRLGQAQEVLDVHITVEQ
jgi:transglutaminase-like putative cysteine protease